MNTNIKKIVERMKLANLSRPGNRKLKTSPAKIRKLLKLMSIR